MSRLMNDATPDACPLPIDGDGRRIVLAHGEGGRLMRQLVRQEIMPALDNEYLRLAGDAAVLPAVAGRLAFTADSFVVSPLFFPGGDIGSLAVYGTVNDLAVAGAKPQWISLSLILAEGLELTVLRRVLASVAAAARRAGVVVVAGDTKVVPRDAADLMFINASGVGTIVDEPPPGPRALAEGDVLIVSGPLGRHGIAVMAAREGLDFDPPPKSDSAPLAAAVAAIQEAGIAVRAMRDATRGGLGAVLHEWAEASGATLAIEEQRLPISPDVRGACELLGLDPIHVANEGTMLIAARAADADRILDVLRQVPEAPRPAVVGRVERPGVAPVVVDRGLGRRVPLDEPTGSPLPRIC